MCCYLTIILVLLCYQGHFVVCSNNICNEKGCSKCVYVSTKFTEKTCIRTGENWNCSDLSTAFDKISSLDDFCILLNDSQSLKKQITRTKVKNLTIIGLSHDIDCSGQNSGFLFYNSDMITFRNLNLKNCGGEVNSTAYDTRDHTIIPAKISSALYFDNTKNIQFDNVMVNSSKGYGIFMLDCIGDIHFSKLIVTFNTPVTLSSGNYNFTSGGGIVFQHLSVGTELSSNNIKVDGHGTQISYITSHTQYDWIRPFGHGGGISLLFLGNTTGNIVTIKGAGIHDNKAVSGGGLYLEHGLHSANNEIVIEFTDFQSNVANSSGGGMFYYTRHEPELYNNKLNLITCRFVSNKADEVGGGFGFRNERFNLTKLNPAHSNISTVFSGFSTLFLLNKANLGSALYFHDAHVSFEQTREGVLIQSNNLDGNGLAAVYAYKSAVVVNTEVDISNNFRTGLVLDYSQLYIYKSVFLQNNRGVDGGGVALYEQSQIFLSDTAELVIKDNKANRGGGMYIKLSGALFIWHSHELNIYECYFQPINKSNEYPGNISFVNNQANGNDGDQIFTTSLQPCLKVGQNVSTTFFNWSNFNGLNTSSVVTEPVMINKTDTTEWKLIYPGKRNSLGMRVTDELNNSVSTVVSMKIRSLDGQKISVEHGYEQFIVFNNTLQEFVLLGDKKTNFQLEFTLSSGKAEPLTLHNLTLYKCPFGYTFVGERCICENSRNAARGITQCKNEEIYVLANMWAKPNQLAEDTDTETLQPCPEGYCRECDGTDENKVQCKYNSSNQCAPGRDQSSLLCSKCERNLSVTYGGETCQDCSGTNPYFTVTLIILVVIVGTFSVVFILLFLGVGVYENYLSSIFFFYQVVGLFYTTTQKFDVGMKVVSGIINVDGFKINGSGICIDEHLSILWKPLLNLLICFCVIMHLFLISKFGKKVHLFRMIFDKRFDYFRKEYSCRALVLFVFWTYSSITQISMKLLQPVKIDGDYRAYEYAAYGYFESWRILLFTIGLVLVTFVVMLFPILLIASDCFKRWKRFQEVTVVFDMFKICFKKDWMSQAFSVYYFIWRLILILTRTFMATPNQVVLTVLTCLSIVMLICFVLKKPYKDRQDYKEEDARDQKSGEVGYIDDRPYYLNEFDTIVLFVLCAVGVISSGKQKLSVHDDMDGTFEIVVNVLTWVPFVMVVVVISVRLWMQVKEIYKKKSNQKNKDYRKLK